MRKEDKSKPNTTLCEQLVSPANIQEAIKKVMANKGAGGVDGMEVNELPDYFETHWPEICKQIVNRKYKPKSVFTGRNTEG
jgi:RNA-directed DNA polymerase